MRLDEGPLSSNSDRQTRVLRLTAAAALLSPLALFWLNGMSWFEVGITALCVSVSMTVVQGVWRRFQARATLVALRRRRALYADAHSDSGTALLPAVQQACFDASLSLFADGVGLQFASRGHDDCVPEAFDPQLAVVAVGQSGGFISVTAEHSQLPDWCARGFLSA